MFEGISYLTLPKIFSSSSSSRKHEVSKEALEGKIRASLDANQYEDSLCYLEKMIKMENSHHWMIMKATCLIHLENFEKAREILEEILKEDPKNCEATFVLAKCFYHEGDLSLSITLLDEIINEKPFIREERERVDEILQILQKAKRNFRRREYNHALEKFSKALDLASDNKRVIATIYINRGMARKGVKQYERALSDFDEALKLSSDDLLIHHRRVICLFACGRFEECKDECVKALEIRECYIVKNLLKKTTKKLLKRQKERPVATTENIPMRSFHNLKNAMGLY